MNLKVLVVGAGMYVSGRGASGYRGTILPALLEARRDGVVGEIGIATTRTETAKQAEQAISKLAQDMGVDGAVSVYPGTETQGDAFMSAAEEMKPDASIVSVPDDLHADVSIPLMERGVHCLVVKPLAGTLDEAKRMTDVANRNGVVAQVEFHKRLDESNILLRDAIEQGRIGTPLYAVIEYSQRKLVPEDVFKTWAARSNIFQYLGVHYVDLILWATGYTPIRVTAWGQKSYLVSKGIDTWDSMQVAVEWDTGSGSFVSTHITNWIDPNNSTAMSDQKISVVGTGGRIQADQKHRGLQIVTDETGAEDPNPYFTMPYKDAGDLRFSGYGIASVRRFLDDVCRVVSGDTPVGHIPADRPSFEQGVISTAVLEAALQSLASGSNPVTVDLPEANS